MSRLEEIVKEKTKALDAEHRRVLADFKNSLSGAAEYARSELPRIEAALGELDRWRQRHIDAIEWQSIGGKPKSISDLEFSLEGIRGNPGALRESLRQYDALRWEQIWGKRSDGQRDVNAANQFRGNFYFLLARRCVRSIHEIRDKLKSILANLEERSGSVGVTDLVREPQGAELTVLSGTDRDERWQKTVRVR
ncbi:MAG TPA: hypothetical protein VEQ38_09525 [Verrucomicrobiae bacterium]|nr:hypothetical protein [Verrucomicrobiae bacterium]